MAWRFDSTAVTMDATTAKWDGWLAAVVSAVGGFVARIRGGNRSTRVW